MWIFGVVLFALGICISVALHEAGHMLTAKAFGMRVRRYFIGFGPKIFSFRRGETEYGLKAIPAGGFCDIAGMTALDPVTAEEAPRAMWRFPVWKRVVVLSAGSITHFILGFLVLYAMSATMGLPTGEAFVGGTDCAAASQNPKTGELTPCSSSDPSPARAAGIQSGDQIVAVNGHQVNTWQELVGTVRDLRGENSFTVRRDGDERTVQVDVAAVQRLTADAVKGSDTNKVIEVGAIGIAPGYAQYSPLSAVGGTVRFTGEMFANTWQGLMKFPEKVPAVIRAIGGQNDPERPVSVVGASIIGGDAAQHNNWDIFILMLAALNFFVGVFNLLPLLPLDGGHIAITGYEKIRDWVRGLRGQPAGGPVDYTKLTALTMVVVFLGGAVVLLTVTADIVNPIRLQ